MPTKPPVCPRCGSTDLYRRATLHGRKQPGAWVLCAACGEQFFRRAQWVRALPTAPLMRTRGRVVELPARPKFGPIKALYENQDPDRA